MSATLNSAGLSKAKSLISGGSVNRTASWSFSAADGKAILGAPPKWAAYGEVHLGIDTSAPGDTEAHYKYPFAKMSGGKLQVYASAVRAIRSRASQQGDTAVFDAAGELMKLINPKDDIDHPAIQEQNESLCRAPGEIREVLFRGTPAADEALSDAIAKVGIKGLSESIDVMGPYVAKVQQGDVQNGNDRIYPRETLSAAMERAKPRMAEGKFTGAVDHPGFSGGGMKDTCIVWHDMTMESDGSVMGTYSIASRHSRGADLQANIDAGIKPGFSSRGWGSAHRPTPEECARFGLPEDTEAVIINPDYEWRKTDAVDEPSVEDAYHVGPCPASGDNAANEPPILETKIMFKTLEELKAQNPDLHKLHEAAIAAAVLAAVTPLQAKVADRDTKITELGAKVTKLESIEKFIGDFNKFQEGLKLHSFIAIPERQVSKEEDAAKIEQANQALATQKVETQKLADKVKQLEADLETRKAAEVQATRKAAVSAKLSTLLKDHKWSEEIGGELTDQKLLDAPAFDEAGAEKFVKDRAAAYDAIAAKMAKKNPMWGLTGTDPLATEANGESQPALAALL